MYVTKFHCGTTHKVIDLIDVDYDKLTQSAKCLEIMVNPYGQQYVR